MKWNEVNVQTISEAVEPVSEILMSFGASGVAIDDALDYQHLTPDNLGEVIVPEELEHVATGAIISAYYPETIFLPEILPLIKERIQGLIEFGFATQDSDVTVQEVEESHWATAWKKYYHPVRVTRHLTVTPSWEVYQPKSSDERVIILDPGMAFGTGTHPTTVLSLEMLEIILRGGETILDVGTGSGVLSIAANLLGADKIQAFDLDDVAVQQARLNIDLNADVEKIEVHANNLLTDIHEQVDVVVANILAEIIVPLIPQAWENLVPNGYFLTSGIIADKATLIREKLEAHGFIIEQQLQMKDWFGIIARKPNQEGE